VESAGLQDRPERQDFRLLPVSGLEIAMSLGGVVINNMILLGVYTQVVGPLPAQLIEGELDRKYGDNGALLNRNKEAFRKGIELGKNVKVQ
ncbi:2-oxoacid:acceptor oxidoreductase family protein, partial [Chloroflexota bacterium]